MDVLTLIKYLTLLGLSDEPVITDELVRKQYRLLSKDYHPDTAGEAYQDGERFALLTEAKDWLLDHIDDTNAMIVYGFGLQDTTVEQVLRRKEAERKAWEQEQREQRARKVREAEARKAAEAWENEKARKWVENYDDPYADEDEEDEEDEEEYEDGPGILLTLAKFLNIISMILIVVTGAPVLFGSGNLIMIMVLIVSLIYFIVFNLFLNRK